MRFLLFVPSCLCNIISLSLDLFDELVAISSVLYGWHNNPSRNYLCLLVNFCTVGTSCSQQFQNSRRLFLPSPWTLSSNSTCTEGNAAATISDTPAGAKCRNASLQSKRGVGLSSRCEQAVNECHATCTPFGTCPRSANQSSFLELQHDDFPAQVRRVNLSRT